MIKVSRINQSYLHIIKTKILLKINLKLTTNLCIQKKYYMKINLKIYKKNHQFMIENL